MTNKIQKLRSQKGATLTEYAILLVLIAVIAILAVSGLGLNVKKAFDVADATLQNPIPSVPVEEEEEEEPQEGEPLVMTFNGPARFNLFINLADSELFPEPRIDWGDNGQACSQTVTSGSVTYQCDFSQPSGNVVSVYAPVFLLSNFGSTLTGIESWGDMEIVSLSSAFVGATSLETLPSDLPPTVTTLYGAFQRLSSTLPTVNTAPVWTSAPVSVPEQISTWDVSNVRNMAMAFRGALDIPDLSNWQTSQVTDMSVMFDNTRFNGDVSRWDVSNVSNMGLMFQANPVFNQDIGDWNTSRSLNMSAMFRGASAFNQDIGDWDVSNVEYLGAMFAQASAFNQDLSRWDTGSAFHVTNMFSDATAFNQDVSMWDSRRFVQMTAMFRNTPNLLGDYSNWRPVPSVAGNIGLVFFNSSGTGDLRCWDVDHITSTPSRFSDNSGISHPPLWGQQRDAACLD